MEIALKFHVFRNHFTKTDKAIDTKLQDNIQTIVRVILVAIRTVCMLRCLGNDARREVPDNFKVCINRGSRIPLGYRF